MSVEQLGQRERLELDRNLSGSAAIVRRRYAELYKVYPVVSGLGAKSPRHRALLNFVVGPFRPGFRHVVKRSHANYEMAKIMVDTLAEFGFGVDVTDSRNRQPPEGGDYDLILGQGNAFVESCQAARPIPKIYFGWGPPVKATRKAVAARRRAVKRRRQLDIIEEHPADDGPRVATEVWYLGNESVRQSYQRATNVPVHELPNLIVSGVAPPRPGKQFKSARRCFLWMANHRPVRRSLDLLLELFAERLPGHELWVCGGLEHERLFFKAYSHELLGCPNIHYTGSLDVASDRYHEITHRCGYMLYPSVADGMPGSVVNAMAEGVVPIVTDAAGMDCGGFGQLIPRLDLWSLKRLVLEASVVAPSELARESLGVSEFAWRRYSPSAFRQAFRDRLAATLSAHN
jgi:hypothetical protein